MSAILTALASLLLPLLKWIGTLPKETGRMAPGAAYVVPTALDVLRARAKRHGVVGLVVLSLFLPGCGVFESRKEVVIATLHPVEDQTKGFLRVAQTEVRCIIDGTADLVSLAPAGGYFIVHEADFLPFLRWLRERSATP